MIRITQKQVALHAKVSVMTVSRALRDDPRVPAAERTRIQAVAREVGYLPDPMLSALAAYRSGARSATPRATLAFIDNGPPDWPHRRFDWFNKLRLGVGRRAASLGYSTDHFMVGPEGQTPSEVSRILHHRGVQGIIVAPFGCAEARLDLDWSKFCAVAIGYHLKWPVLNYAANAHFQGMRLALSELRSLGYRRIGFAHRSAPEQGVDSRRMAAYLVDQHLHARKKHAIPPLLVDELDSGALLRWVRRHEPEAIVGLGVPAIGWLIEAGFRVPEDIGVATLTREDPHTWISGIEQRLDRVGEAAVDLLHSLLLRGETGIPKTPRGIITHGHWVEADSTRRLG